MGIIVDEKNKPIVEDAKEDEGSPKNGHGHEQAQGMQDVRAIPTGTLIYNLVMHTGGEMGLKNMLEQIKQAKQANKAIGPHPMEQAIEKQFMQAVEARTIIAREINLRFKDIDAQRMAACGIEIIEPVVEPTEEDKPES